MALLKEQFDIITDNKFPYLKITRAAVYLRKQSATVYVIFPAEHEKEVFSNRNEIERAFVTCALNSKLNIPVTVDLKRSHFDFDLYKGEFFEILKQYPSLFNTLSAYDVTCIDSEISVRVADSVCDYIESVGADKQIRNAVANSFCEPITVNFIRAGEIDVPLESANRGNVYVFDKENEGRSIRAQNVEEYIGKIVYDMAGYIEDAVSPREIAVLCGRILNIRERSYKRATDGEDALLRHLYNFELEDYTGRIHCTFFASQKNRDKFLAIKEGKQIIMRGKIEEDKRNAGVMNFIPRDISLCTLPEEFSVNRMRRAVSEEYLFVKPQPYIDASQTSLFDVKIEPPAYLIGKTFCVFDVETTGYNPDSDKIIEIAAVKITDGVIKETFSSFVDPREPIPERIIDLTHIDDNMVRGQPKIEEVLPDFYKFADGCILVGQNVQFDCGFITAKGRKMKIFFDNDTMDTLILAQKYVPGLKNYKLGTIAKSFGFINENAHRAISDAIITAKVFMELAKFL